MKIIYIQQYQNAWYLVNPVYQIFMGKTTKRCLLKKNIINEFPSTCFAPDTDEKLIADFYVLIYKKTVRYTTQQLPAIIKLQ